MADLEKHGTDRPGWLRWAIALLKRGIWAADIITVHGPHGPEVPFMWGECYGELDGETPGTMVEVTFRTRGRSRGIRDLRGLRVTESSSGDTFPLLKASELSPKARRWLRVAQRLKLPEF